MSLSEFLISRLGSPGNSIRQAPLDSLELMELIMEIEERYAVILDECDLLKDQTIGELSEKLEQQIKDRKASQDVL